MRRVKKGRRTLPGKRLSEYRAKRDFTKTPEPAPRAAKPGSKPTFVVHKHDATRLHYDVRLEIDGALASWSVPKGPSYDPSVKRLAVQTEDHPLEYGSFEGRIPDGEYGAGDSLIWDRGTVDSEQPGQLSEQRKRGRIHAVFDGEKLKGGWHLVRTRQGWLMFKASDATARRDYDVIAERPESVVSGRVVTRGPERAGVLRATRPPPEKLLEGLLPPMLATLVEEAPAGGGWLQEVKYDGYRALCALSNGRVAMITRNGLDLTARFPGVARALAQITVGDAVIDGEVAVLDAKGVTRFELMHGASGELFAFDLLRLDGEDLRQRPLHERRELLGSLLSNAPPGIRLSEEVRGDGLAQARERGLEGVILKQRDSVYEHGRSRAWLKLKAQNSEELAIIGWMPGKGAASGSVGALLLGVATEGGYRFAGKVGTGFSAKQRRELLSELKSDEVPQAVASDAPRLRAAHWVKPRLFAQVRFTEWTADGKLRHPAFLGQRIDKSPQEARTEVELTNPDRLLYPGITKKDVAAYYDAVSEPLLRALKDRPLALIHFNRGIGGPRWFHQNTGDDAPEWAARVETPLRTRKGAAQHLIADRPETLRWLAQRAALEIHCWHSRAQSLTQPDWVLFDLDPAEGIDEAVEVAQILHGMFERMGLPSLVKTTGKRGLHIHIPLAPGHTYDDAQAFALQVGRAVEKQLPKLVTLERSRAKRNGRLYFDCLQNGYGKTAIAPYSLRGEEGAPVAAPLRWSEVSRGLDPLQFNLHTMPERLRSVGDLFALPQGVRLRRA